LRVNRGWTPYHARGLMEFPESRPDKGTGLTPEKGLDRDRDGEFILRLGLVFVDHGVCLLESSKGKYTELNCCKTVRTIIIADISLRSANCLAEALPG